MTGEPQDKYQFADPSGLIVHVEHIVVPLRTIEGKHTESVHQQPSSRIFIEVPPTAAVTWQEVYEGVTGNKPPAGFKPEPGNRLAVGTVTNMITQISITQSLTESGLFEEQTLRDMHQCCNNPTPAAARSAGVAK